MKGEVGWKLHEQTLRAYPLLPASYFQAPVQRGGWSAKPESGFLTACDQITPFV